MGPGSAQTRPIRVPSGASEETMRAGANSWTPRRRHCCCIVTGGLNARAPLTNVASDFLNVEVVFSQQTAHQIEHIFFPILSEAKNYFSTALI